LRVRARSSNHRSQHIATLWIGRDTRNNGWVNLRGPFAFWVGRDYAFIALLIPAGLLKIATAYVAEGAPKTRALSLIFGLAIALRGLIPGGHQVLAVHVSHRFVPAAPEIPLNRTGHGA
jgi:hypothetical protein